MQANEDIYVSFDGAVECLYQWFINGNANFVPHNIQAEKISKKGLMLYKLKVMRCLKPENFELAEDLHLLIRLGKITGEQAVEYYEYNFIKQKL